MLIGLTQTKDALKFDSRRHKYDIDLNKLVIFWDLEHAQDYTESDTLRIGLPYLRLRSTRKNIIKRWKESYQALQSQLKYIQFNKTTELRVPVTPNIVLIAWWHPPNSL
jgi:hypothetical protein